MYDSGNIHTAQKTVCYHCGEDCKDDSVRLGDKVFCCTGCRTVYEMLSENDLCDYYAIEENPGVTKKNEVVRNYEFLNDNDLKNKLIDFSDGTTTTLTLYIPQMHCSSCIWILENLYKLNRAVIDSRVNFLKKQLTVKYKEQETTLKEIVELLDSLGYEPNLSLAEKEEEKNLKENRRLLYKIGVAGFSFGNVMLMSFPEYLALDSYVNDSLRYTFSYLNFLLSIPVFLYSASEYFISAYKGLQNKLVNIDVPVALGIIVLFLRSCADIAFEWGPGYFDSLTGLVFFLLIGRFFQNKTYETLNFERNYKSYFPIAVTTKKNHREISKPVEKIEVGERLVIRNNEIIPADSVLIRGKAGIDYSFVTGESAVIDKKTGDIIFAGGKQIGEAIEVDTVKEVSQSYLTRLWNNDIFTEDKESKITTLANQISKYFTFVILAIAFGSTAYWFTLNSFTAFHVFTAVLIVACPCALALSTPFTMGNTLRIFGLNKFYLKNIKFIEELGKINTIVFDKTGTITESGNSEISFIGSTLSEDDSKKVASLARNSAHPASKKIYGHLNCEELYTVNSYTEVPGKGVSGEIEGDSVKLGSAEYIFETPENTEEKARGTKVFVSINDKFCGYFLLANKYRKGLSELMFGLKNNFNMAVISGDNNSEEGTLKEIFPPETKLLFKQSPQDKFDFIAGLQKQGKKVLMIGDGLNDAGALRKSDIGISIAEDVNNFTPASDAILEAGSFNKLPQFFKFAKTSHNIVIVSFIISFIYNLIGIGFAVTGMLSPVIAAILMPLSSITVVVVTTALTGAYARMKGML